jgi:hypothetical protein
MTFGTIMIIVMAFGLGVGVSSVYLMLIRGTVIPKGEFLPPPVTEDDGYGVFCTKEDFHKKEEKEDSAEFYSLYDFCKYLEKRIERERNDSK